MQMVIIFDKDVDIIDVPPTIVANKSVLRKKFLRWLYNKDNTKSYKVHKDTNGKQFVGVRYRSDSFVEWLNKKVLYNSDEKATVISQQVSDYPNDMPTLFF